MESDPSSQHPSPRITRLPEILINQIAAGEVVERPASAVKELVENALDAGSTRIEVLLQAGGTESIAIVDNGGGMVPDDLVLCVERHATSKIRSLEDLEAVGSYGFRGEALASIASVSQLKITSRPRGSDRAHTLTLDFGVTTEPLRPCGAPVGTRVEVRGLFAKLPARQKFLRTAATEFSACAKAVRELALGCPGVDIFLHHQDRRSAEYVGADRAARFAEAFRVPWTPVHGAEATDGVALEFFLSPADWLQERGELLLFINGRGVRNRNLLAAVRNAYLTALGPHHEPSGVVYLDIRPDWIDANVHPQKLEVRCLRQESLYPWLLSAVRRAVQPKVPVKVAESPADYGARDGAVLRYVGKLRGEYVLCEDPAGLLVIDPKRAGIARRARELAGALPLAPQALPAPVVVRLPLDLAGIFDDNTGLLARLGFEIEPFGNADLSVKACPAGAEALFVLAVLRRLAGKSPEEKETAAVAALAELSAADERLPASAPDADAGPWWYRIGYSALEKHFDRGES